MNNEKPKILLVEDDLLYIKLYTDKLKKAGFIVLVADNENNGFDKAIVEKPTLIIIDISLPEEDDFWLLKQLKTNDKTANVPIIILSDLNDEEDVNRAKELGADDYLIRSDIVFEDIVDKIKIKTGGK